MTRVPFSRRRLGHGSLGLARVLWDREVGLFATSGVPAQTGGRPWEGPSSSSIGRGSATPCVSPLMPGCPTSAANVRDLLAEPGIDVSARTVLTWVQTFGPLLAEASRRRVRRIGTRWWYDDNVRAGQGPVGVFVSSHR
jgi:hypothetical protein